MPKNSQVLTHKQWFGGVVLIGLSLSVLLVLPLIPLHGDKQLKLPANMASRADFLLVFFGYPHCNSICPKTLKDLSQAYTQNPRYQQGSLEVWLVNLYADEDLANTQSYVEGFHSAFKAAVFDAQSLEQLKADFGIIAYQTAENSDQLSHSEQIYLLEKQSHIWLMKTIYRHSTEFKQRFSLEAQAGL